MRKFWDGSIHLSGTPRWQNRHSGKLRTGIQTARIALFALGVSLFALAPVCHAQSDAPGNDAPAAAQETPPTGNHAASQSTGSTPANVRVVRLSDVEGTVQLLRGNETQFSQAVMNMPLMQGSRITTGADGRAEIEFEDGSVARITPNSSLSIMQLQSAADGTLDTSVEQLSGLIYYELRSDPKTPFKVIVGGRTVTPTVNSTFRINVGAAPPELAVIDGGVRVHGASDSYQADVQQGKTIQFQSADSAKYTIADGITPNGFDEWNDQRDQEAAQEAQNQTPARVQQGGGSIMDSGIGWSDLDNAGGWYPLPGYGMVWQPFGVGADFDPYGDGMWADFGGDFGYSWVSGYPWGWLPFHCGMWSYIGGFGWGWMPGAYPFRGVGFGYGGYGYGGRRYPYTNIYGGPAGYRVPVPPAIVKGQLPARIVRVGSYHGPAMGSAVRVARLHGDHLTAGRLNAVRGNDATRQVRFNGSKIAPLHSMLAGVRVPTRNAALYNNYPTRAFHEDIRTAVLNRSNGAIYGPGAAHMGSELNRSDIGHGHHELVRSGNLRGENFRAHHDGSVDGLRGPMSASRAARFNAERGEVFARHSFGAQNRAFGRPTSFGSRGGFGGVSRGGIQGSGIERSRGFGGGGFRGGNGMSRAGGFHGGGNMGRVGNASSGGFHGGGMSHAGGVSGGGGMGHAGGFAGGGGGGGHAGGFSGGGNHGR